MDFEQLLSKEKTYWEEGKCVNRPFEPRNSDLGTYVNQKCRLIRSEVNNQIGALVDEMVVYFKYDRNPQECRTSLTYTLKDVNAKEADRPYHKAWWGKTVLGQIGDVKENEGELEMVPSKLCGGLANLKKPFTYMDTEDDVPEWDRYNMREKENFSDDDEPGSPNYIPCSQDYPTRVSMPKTALTW